MAIHLVSSVAGRPGADGRLTGPHRGTWRNEEAKKRAGESRKVKPRLPSANPIRLEAQEVNASSDLTWRGERLVCAAAMGRRFGSRLGLRTLDTLHVAMALEMRAQRFWTFDERQKRLARAVGLKTA